MKFFAAPTILLISLFLGSSTAYALTPADLTQTSLPVTVEIQIEQGDTLSKLAEKYDTSIDILVYLNRLENPDFIIAGKTLIIRDDEAMKYYCCWGHDSY